MTGNVLLALGQRSEKTLRRAAENKDLCNAFMAVLNWSMLMAYQKGKSSDGIVIEQVNIKGGRITAQLRFYSIGVAKRPRHMESCRGIDEFIGKHASHLYGMMQTNDNFFNFLNDVVIKLDAYCAEKGCDFAEIKLAGIIDDTDMIVLEMK